MVFGTLLFRRGIALIPRNGRRNGSAGGRTCGLFSSLARRITVACSTILISIASTAALEAQNTGRVVGRVLDSETGRGLVGAQIAIQGTGIGTLAGVDGRYIIASAPAGRQTVSVTYLGYGTKSITDVEVIPGSVVNLDVAITPAAIALEGLTVSAERDRGSVGRALDAQRTAVGVTSAVTAEQISRSPDSDAAAAIQRVSGVTVQEGKYVSVRGLGERYTTTSLNGARVPSPEPERKMVPLDLFPANLLQTITTSKTFTPNLPGDFSGAQVDIRTKEFPAQRQVSFSFSTGYADGVTGRMLPMAPRAGGEWLARAAGPRLIPGVVRSTTQPRPGAETNQMIGAFRNAWSVVEESARPNSSIGVSVGGSDEILGQRVGYLASGTYSSSVEASLDQRRARAGSQGSEYDRFDGATGRHSVLWGGLANVSTMVGAHSRFSLNNAFNRSADNEGRRETGFYENHGTNVQIERLRYVERSVRSNQLLAEHQLGQNHRLDWSLTSSGVSRQEPDRSEFVTWLDPTVPTWYNEEGSSRNFAGLDESNLEGAVNYRLELGSVMRRHALQVGGLFRNTDRDAFNTGYSIKSPIWTPTDPRWQMRPEEFFDGRFSNGSEANFEIAPYNAGGNYAATDRLLAGYGMAEISLTPRLRAIGGARVEQSEVEVSYQSVLGESGTATPSYVDILPSLAFNYDLTDRQKLRLSAAQTLARPEYREIAPVPFRGGLGEDQRQGNPGLVRTLIQNYDLRWELYPSPGEVVSIGVFAKRFQDPVEERYLARSGTNTLSFENAESAVNYGVEAEVMRNLGVLTEALTPLSLFANATWMHSRVNTGVEGDPVRSMVGQAPYVVNTGVTYTPRRGATTGTLLFNVVGERVVSARPSGVLVDDVVQSPRPMLDFSFRFPLLGGANGKLDLKNLLDSPYEQRQGEITRDYYRSGRSLSVGLSWQQ
jgi:outer membrane receptor for ferrienterochelin and colicin